MEPQQVAHSTGLERARTAAPSDATDTHIHIYDSRFPVAPRSIWKDASEKDWNNWIWQQQKQL